jgi:hypothetical protein
MLADDLFGPQGSEWDPDRTWIACAVERIMDSLKKDTFEDSRVQNVEAVLLFKTSDEAFRKKRVEFEE